MGIPKVVIVGRPNVGKSSIFNWLVGRRIAIVDDQPGVTRDRMTRPVEYDDGYFELIDTGGIGIEDVDNLTSEIEQQIAIGIDEAALILFVVDGLTGLLPLDNEVAVRLRSVKKPTLLVVNKSDSPKRDANAEEFRKLGFGDILLVSTKGNRNKEQLLTAIVEALPTPSDPSDVDDPEMKVAIVGRRNVGKSTFVNTLVKADRMIVSEVPGTTRDSVDVRFEMDGKSFIAIDTPGLRRRVSVRTDIDFYGLHRAKQSIRRADVVLLFLDAADPVGRVDKQLCGYIVDQYKPCIFVVNKWDLYHGKVATEEWVEYLRKTFGTMWHVPIAFITGQTGKNTKTLLNHAQMLFKQSRSRIGTGQLNGLIHKALELNQPPLYRNRRAKIFFATQISIQPPTIVLVCNEPAAFSKTYRRYLLGILHDQLDFGEVPIQLFLKKRDRRDTPDGARDLAQEAVEREP
jgi:GTP-binding protein